MLHIWKMMIWHKGKALKCQSTKCKENISSKRLSSLWQWSTRSFEMWHNHTSLRIHLAYSNAGIMTSFSAKVAYSVAKNFPKTLPFEIRAELKRLTQIIRRNEYSNKNFYFADRQLNCHELNFKFVCQQLIFLFFSFFELCFASKMLLLTCNCLLCVLQLLNKK